MIQFLVDAYNWIIEFMNTISKLIISAVTGLASVIQSFPKIFNLITGSLAFVPNLFMGFISVTAIILIVYIIVGRESGSSS